MYVTCAKPDKLTWLVGYGDDWRELRCEVNLESARGRRLILPPPPRPPRPGVSQEPTGGGLGPLIHKGVCYSHRARWGPAGFKVETPSPGPGLRCPPEFDRAF